MGRSEVTVRKGRPYPLGATPEADGINFAAVLYEKADCGLILYEKKKPHVQIRIPFHKDCFIGNIACIFVERIKPEVYDYHFYCQDKVLGDPYAKWLTNTAPFGNPADAVRMGIPAGDFDWQDDRPLKIPFEESLFYCTHVRGFTKNRKSGVKRKGTFLGLTEKIPYLKELGVKNLELQPIYEFSDWEAYESPQTIWEAANRYMDGLSADAAAGTDGAKEAGRVNFWGYQKAYYFAPKAAYAYGKDPVTECKTLVRECHKQGMEVILQFYFPEEYTQGYILEVLKYWVLEYHIDGFRLLGQNIPRTLLATEPLFGDTKLISDYFPYDEIYRHDEQVNSRHLASANDGFMNDARRFLKGDEDMLNRMISHICGNSPKHGELHYITSYNGFTLADLVSYDRKYNEANGEENRDGTDYNYSWNCGMEGKTKKSVVLRLRNRQMRNALALVMLSQGTPCLRAGDEDCNSQSGNNNPYCQDNEVGWKDWNENKQTTALRSFLKELIRFRAAHPVLRKKDVCAVIDRLSCGFPEISFHGEEAFSLQTAAYNRQFAVLYAGAYGNGSGDKDADVYIVYNMHWLSNRFALPKLKKGYGWKRVMDTAKEESFFSEEIEEDFVLAEGRSIQVLVSEKIV